MLTLSFLVQLTNYQSVRSTSFSSTRRNRMQNGRLRHKPVIYRVPRIESDYKPVDDGSEFAPVISHITTQKPVVFLTIDDGKYKSPESIKMLTDNNIKASLFVARPFIEDEAGYFDGFPKKYFSIENHSLNHQLGMYRMPYQQQIDEICGGAEYLGKTYNQKPKLFRPPGGNYTGDTLRAAKACGMKSVVLWTALSDSGRMEYQDTNSLKPGDIVLMHFRHTFKEDLRAFIDAKNAAGLQSELLEDWIK